MRVDEERILPNRDLSIREGAVKASGWYYAEGSVAEMYYLGLGKKYGFTLDTPIREMSTEPSTPCSTAPTKKKSRCTARMSSAAASIIIPLRASSKPRAPLPRDEQRVDEEEIGSFMSGVECPRLHGKRLNRWCWL